MIKIKQYRVTKNGRRGFTVTLPKVWVSDLMLGSGDAIDIYRDEQDRLILVPLKNGAHDRHQGDGRS